MTTKHKRQRKIDTQTPSWMITYADMATLLLVFFVFLFSVSEIKRDKLKAAIGSLRQTAGLLPYSGSIRKTNPSEARSRRHTNTRKTRGLPGELDRVGDIARGKRIIFGKSLSFAQGSADIDDEAKKRLRVYADHLRGLPNVIELRGHASKDEGANLEGFEDELALSLARGAAVLRFLVKDAGLSERHLRVLGAGSQEPFADGVRATRALDRRVEILTTREIIPAGTTRVE